MRFIKASILLCATALFSSQVQATQDHPSSDHEIFSLAKAAKNGTGPEREMALRDLAQPATGAISLGDAYLSLLADKDVYVQTAAAQACAVLSEKRAVPLLRSFVQQLPKHSLPGDERDVFEPAGSSTRDANPEHIRGGAAARSLIELGDWDSVEAVLERKILRHLWPTTATRFGQRVLPLLVSEARKRDKEIREYALRAILRVNDEGAVIELKRLASDKNEDVRGSAAVALAQMASQDAQTTGSSTFASLSSKAKSELLYLCAFECDPTRAASFVKTYLQSHEPSLKRIDVINGLGASGNPGWVPVLEADLHDPDGFIRAGVACELARVTGTRYNYGPAPNSRAIEEDCPFWSAAHERKE